MVRTGAAGFYLLCTFLFLIILSPSLPPSLPPFLPPSSLPPSLPSSLPPFLPPSLPLPHPSDRQCFVPGDPKMERERVIRVVKIQKKHPVKFRLEGEVPSRTMPRVKTASALQGFSSSQLPLPGEGGTLQKNALKIEK